MGEILLVAALGYMIFVFCWMLLDKFLTWFKSRRKK